MDITALQTTITNLTAQEESQQAALTDTQNQLAAANDQLKNANVINALEALDPAALTALNAALAADPDNTHGVSVAGNFPDQGAQA